MTYPDLHPEFRDRAEKLLGPKGFRTDDETRDAVSAPWRGTYQGHTPLVARPNSTEMCAAFVRLCAEYGVAVTPQGGNTGLVDAGTPHGEVTLSMGRMTEVRAVDAINNSLTIEAGAPLVRAQEAADQHNRLFPLSLGSEGTATIGGLISTNAGGVAVLRYGMMRDLLLGLEVVLANGEIWDGLSGLRKNNTGYDLKHVFAGAEGTLGIITAATLKLFPKVAKSTAWISCETAQHVVDLLALVRDHAGDTVTSFEMIPANAIEMICAENLAIRDPNPSPLAWRVLCEISMAREDHAREVLETALAAAFEHGLASDAVIAENLTQARSFWTIRETIPLSKRAYGTAVNHDVSVPVSHIPDFLAQTETEICNAFPGSEIIAFGHVGDGNLHYSACEPKSATMPVLANHERAITDIVHRQAMSHDGSISAEHGVGRLKRDELASLRSPAATQAMKAIKRALDPQGLMNPNRVVSMD
ncbi:MAG: FAD-binding oxidoreductase [Henriciella sp.]|nr:FAD-binding oxidoreductase [Henriciella sp.]